MTDHAIIFGAPMIRALLAGAKTQTRRLAWRYTLRSDGGRGQILSQGAASSWQRVAAGDRCWVREAWKPLAADMVWYRADGEGPQDFGRWRTPIHLPRRASRVTLLVEAVRTECLWAITVADAAAEGFAGTTDPRTRYAMLWDELHGTDAAWHCNPEVVVVTFRAVARNIDWVAPP